MIPTSFDESNGVLGRPDHMTADECNPLSVFRGSSVEGHPVVVSCWKLTKDELTLINQTGRLYLVVHSKSMPPVNVEVASPFVR